MLNACKCLVCDLCAISVHFSHHSGSFGRIHVCRFVLFWIKPNQVAMHTHIVRHYYLLGQILNESHNWVFCIRYSVRYKVQIIVMGLAWHPEWLLLFARTVVRSVYGVRVCLLELCINLTWNKLNWYRHINVKCTHNSETLIRWTHFNRSLSTHTNGAQMRFRFNVMLNIKLYLVWSCSDCEVSKNESHHVINDVHIK